MIAGQRVRVWGLCLIRILNYKGKRLLLLLLLGKAVEEGKCTDRKQ